MVLRAPGLGDLLVAVPALRGLRRARPDDHLVLATPGGLAPVVRWVGAVDELLPCADPGALRAAWHGRAAPATAVNLHGDGATSREALLGLDPRRYVGEVPGSPAPGHERLRWCRLLERAGLLAVGAGAAARDVRLGEHRPDTEGTVVVHPGAAYGAKRWPVERFAAVAAAVTAGRRPVVVTGSAAERDRTAAVTAAAGLGADRDRGGRTGLAGLVDLVRGAHLVVSGDTGVAHLATAFGTPSVVLFGPVGAERWGPPADGPHRVLGGAAARRGDPFAPDPDPALLAVGVGDVLAAAWELLGGG